MIGMISFPHHSFLWGCILQMKKEKVKWLIGGRYSDHLLSVTKPKPLMPVPHCLGRSWWQWSTFWALVWSPEAWAREPELTVLSWRHKGMLGRSLFLGDCLSKAAVVRETRVSSSDRPKMMPLHWGVEGGVETRKDRRWMAWLTADGRKRWI